MASTEQTLHGALSVLREVELDTPPVGQFPTDEVRVQVEAGPDAAVVFRAASANRTPGTYQFSASGFGKDRQTWAFGGVAADGTITCDMYGPAIDTDLTGVRQAVTAGFARLDPQFLLLCDRAAADFHALKCRQQLVGALETLLDAAATDDQAQLVVTALSLTDPAARRFATDLVTAGFDGTPADLRRAAQASLTQAASST